LASPRLRFLDGLRGLSAVYIVAFHAFQIGGIVQGQDHLGASLLDRAIKGAYYLVFCYGYCAVTIFIVLSGYSLMLPVARSSDGLLRGGVPEYLRRRARRIMPPYYAALLLSLLLFWVIPGFDQPGADVWWNGALPPYDVDALLAHVLLIHNWSSRWISRINMPMWSVAVEWQIYMLLPTILLPVFRRFGAIAMLGVGLTLGLLPGLLFGELPLGERYIALFALGAFGACLGFSRDPRLIRLRERMPWTAIAQIALLVFIVMMLASFKFWTHTRHFAWLYIDRYSYRTFKDLSVGVATVSMMIRYARIDSAPIASDQVRPLVLRCLELERTAALGRFSYSLYLTHAPVLCALAFGFLRSGWSPSASYLALVVLGTPFSMLFAWMFHWVFERPFIATPAPESRAVPAISP
jgi:peptidoglycan/LPS O-acetylase OafA/YrhL